MSEDTAALATDNEGIWRDPSGIVTLGDSGSEHYALDHGVTLICDSHRSWLTRMAVRRGTRKNKRPRMPCPECARTVTVYIRKGGSR